MSNTKSPPIFYQPTDDSRIRHPQREIADLLATAIQRMPADPPVFGGSGSSAVCLAISADQSVHVNPSYRKGV